MAQTTTRDFRSGQLLHRGLPTVDLALEADEEDEEKKNIR